MKLSSRIAVTPLFRLVDVVECDLQFSDACFSVRIELLESTSRRGVFRCHLWERELYRVAPAAPKARTASKLRSEESLAERTQVLIGDYDEFKAPSRQAALKLVLADLADRAEFAGEEPSGGQRKTGPPAKPRRARKATPR